MGDNDWHEVTRKKHRSVFQRLDFRGFRGSFPQRSKEDQVTHISKSVFVTNFLENFESNDLWKICEGYGKVVDVNIPNRKSKAAGHGFVNNHAPYGSYASVAKDNSLLKTHVFQASAVPALVLDDSCVIDRDLSRHVMGRVKYFNSIPNLWTTLAKEGFPEVKLTYLGGLWVMIELNNEVTMQKLLQHIGVKSWFHVLTGSKPDLLEPY
ncbi:RNA-directed DNA polymerase, eukaryota [Tanacetum coccineum]